ncbi:DegT/DnrJ/EryC1/StrS family aminotransferase [Halofilum ochraceum]|uniref:DegT/DnrJ/EryC1/StrS family aminotransferase n=1 Tax=Halofilum ochraceum TaxID=1611323 RepID=UPI00082F141E|nr:DegT/DnrJ/EryC1/StrS family aminotransferase [Halofilum ochraceum]
MQFIDLAAQQARIRPEIDRRINAVLAHGKYIMGPEIGELEEKLAGYTNMRHAITVSSGTDALVIALMALEIGPGDEVITSPFSFIATAEAITLVGATPVFVDIDPATYNIDPQRIEPAITENTRAIMPVSLYGQCADYDTINEIAARHALPVIEDGAQSLGATHNGRPSCGLTTIGCTSFFPSKPLGGYGDGGACFTNDETLAQRMREIRVHGQERRYHHTRIGVNGRLDTLQAAILLAKFDIFPDEIERRQQVAAAYTRLINEQTDGAITPPHIAAGNTSAYAQYTIRIQRRDAVQRALNEAGIPTAVHYPVPLHHQPVFGLAESGNLEASSKAASEVLSLPMHPYMQESNAAQVVDAACTAANRITA